jgi:hypothetical protein
MGDYFRDERRRYWLGLQVSIGPFVGSGYILLGGALATACLARAVPVHALGAIVLVAAWLWMYEPIAIGRMPQDRAKRRPSHSLAGDCTGRRHDDPRVDRVLPAGRSAWPHLRGAWR